MAEYHNEGLEPASRTLFNFDFEHGGSHMPKRELQELMCAPRRRAAPLPCYPSALLPLCRATLLPCRAAPLPRTAF